MKRIIAVGMLLLPQILHAGTDCRFTEFPDHYDAVCIGDEKAGPTPLASSPALRSAVIPEAQASGKPANEEEKAETQRSALSKRNQEKINAAHMKEVRQKLMLENMR